MNSKLIIAPKPNDPKLSKQVIGIDENQKSITTNVVTEKPMTLFLNKQEIVTMMTIGDHPEMLGLGYLVNQNILKQNDEIEKIEYDDEIDVVVVRTKGDTQFEATQQKRIKTSGCAQGTIFADVIDSFNECELNQNTQLKTSWLHQLTHKINTTPSLYLNAGAIHGCVLCKENKPIVYMEDVGRHNAVDKIAGWMKLNDEIGDDKIFYTTGRLTSEMVIKTVMMKIPILISRSGFTAWGVELARQAGLTLIGRARGKRFIVLAGENRIVYDEKIKEQ